MAQWQCDTKDPSSGYWCCEPKGHSGDHVAIFSRGQECARWPQKAPKSAERCMEARFGNPRYNYCSLPKGYTGEHRAHSGHDVTAPYDAWGAAKADTSAERKAAPLWSGCMNYFPLALLAVARLSKKANDKHNPGEPLHWSREKSNDHFDCAARHLLNPEEIDPEFGEIHLVHVVWRALAQLQLIEEKRLGKTS